MNSALLVNSSLREKSDLVFDRVATIGTEKPDDQIKWLTDLGDCLASWGNVAMISKMQEAELLYTAKKAWSGDSETEPISETAKSRWNYDFYNYVNSYFVREGDQPAQITVHNLISVWEDWVVKGDINPPPKVYLPVRDELGKVIEVGPEGDQEYNEVVFDPRLASYSKLLVARGQARREGLPEEAWSALMDPAVTVTQLKALMKGPQVEESSKTYEPEFYTFFKDGVVYGVEGKDVVGTLTILPENINQPIFARTLDFVLRSMGVTPDITVTTISDKKFPLVSHTDEDLVISKFGTRFGSFSKEEALQIFNEIKVFLDM